MSNHCPRRSLETPSTLPNGISWAEFVFQIFITNEGPTIFVLPIYFKNVGYVPGILGSLAVATFYAYMMSIYSWCDDQIKKKKNIEKQSLYSLVINTFDEYKHSRVGFWLNFYLKYEIILSWALGLSFNLLYAAKNTQFILNYFHLQTSNQFVLLCLAVPTMLIFWFPHIQSMTIFSYFITLTLVVVCLEVLYYLIIDVTENPQVDMINDISTLPEFLLCVFNFISFTAVIFPLKIEMKYPSNLNKIYSAVNVSIFLITILNTLFSLVAYFQLGNNIKDNIIENLSPNRVILFTDGLFIVSIVGGGALSFFVVFQALWNDNLENLFNRSKYVRFYEYVVRSILGLFIILMAMVVPTYGIFINIISCFSYPYTAILLPSILESVIVWNKRRNDIKTVLILIKNLALGAICIGACSVALYKSLTEMLSYYYNIT